MDTIVLILVPRSGNFYPVLGVIYSDFEGFRPFVSRLKNTQQALRPPFLVGNILADTYWPFCHLILPRSAQL